MNARDFLAFNEQLIAFDSLMKGSLQAEIDAAKAALETLGGVKTLQEGQVALSKDKDSFETYKISVQKIFDETKEELNQKEQELSAIEDTLNKKEVSLSTGVYDLESARANLAKDKSTFEEYASQQSAYISSEISKLVQQKEELALSQQSIADRESKLEAKLAALKDIG